MAPRAYIGYLVGYMASNIYRVWVPASGKFIIVRDVTFDETTFYTAGDDIQGIPEAVADRLIAQYSISGNDSNAVSVWGNGRNRSACHY